jgi:hypothetical protein
LDGYVGIALITQQPIVVEPSGFSAPGERVQASCPGPRSPGAGEFEICKQKTPCRFTGQHPEGVDAAPFAGANPHLAALLHRFAGGRAPAPGMLPAASRDGGSVRTRMSLDQWRCARTLRSMLRMPRCVAACDKGHYFEQEFEQGVTRVVQKSTLEIDAEAACANGSERAAATS